MAGVTVRPLRADDRREWEPLWRAYLQFYETSVADDVYNTTWQRLLTPDSDPYGLCAVDGGGTIQGIVHYLFHVTCWAVQPNCYLQDLYVASGARGQGAGRALIQAVYDAADRRGAADVYWTTQHFNHTARQLYDKIGIVTPFIKYKRPPTAPS